MIKKRKKDSTYTKEQGFVKTVTVIGVYDWTFLLVNLFLLLPACLDRPCLEDRGKVQRVQRTVELCLRHILQRDNQESLMPKVSAGQEILNHENTFLLPVGGVTKYARLPCSCTRRWQCCVPCAACTWRSCAGSVSAIRSLFTLCSLHSTRSCSPPRLTCCRGTLSDDCEPQHAQTIACTHRKREFQLMISS